MWKAGEGTCSGTGRGLYTMPGEWALMALLETRACDSSMYTDALRFSAGRSLQQDEGLSARACP